MRQRVIVYFLLLLSGYAFAGVQTEHDSLFHELQRALKDKAMYAKVYEEKLDALKQKGKDNALSLEQAYALNRQIYMAYQSYQSDSALVYLNHALSIAQQLQNKAYIIQTRIDQSYLYWQTGSFFEAIQNMNAIDRRSLDALPAHLLHSYMEAYKRLYRYYANMHTDKDNYYRALSNAYRDSALAITIPDLQANEVMAVEKLADAGNLNEAINAMTKLLSLSAADSHKRAIYADILAGFYRQQGNVAKQKQYCLISAICDIKCAVTENASMQELAILLYQEDDIDDAYRCIQSSMEDAIFYNSRFRTYEITKIFPIIDKAYQAYQAKQQDVLRTYLLVVSFLLLCVIAAIVFVYRQMKRITRMQAELHQTNEKLNALNKELQETNRVKEAYLGQFINLCSGYIDKWNAYRRDLNRIVASGKTDELSATLKSTKYIEKELEEFYTLFDTTFLQIYPTFIDEFYALFPAEKVQKPKHGELLNAELRIYALIRLGITDSTKIALFLRHSITTIYTYRSKLRMRSLCKDALEEEIMKIGK